MFIPNFPNPRSISRPICVSLLNPPPIPISPPILASILPLPQFTKPQIHPPLDLEPRSIPRKISSWRQRLVARRNGSYPGGLAKYIQNARSLLADSKAGKNPFDGFTPSEEGASNLAPDLHAQIDETLEEITPHCVLELLALPLDEQHRVKREEGLVRIQNILWSVGGGGAAAIGGGFTREDLMNEAFTRMTTTEQVELFAATPSNIQRESFEVYGVALALIAQAFVRKNPHLIKDADNLFLQLQDRPLGAVSNFTKRADHEIDFALEMGLCSLLVGDLDGCCSWLGIDSETSPYRNPAIIEFVMDNSNHDNENGLLPGFCVLLETWLVEEVFHRFRDTQDVHFKLRDYYDDPIVLRYLERMDGGGSSPLAAAAAIVKIGAEATLALGNAQLHAFQALQKFFPYGNKRQTTSSEDYTKEALFKGGVLYDSGGDYEALGNSISADSNEHSFIEKFTNICSIIACGTAMVGLLTLVALKSLPRRVGLPAAEKELGSAMAVDIDNLDVPVEESLLHEMPKMDANLAETLVRKWQNIKSQALGPDHCLAQLPEVEITCRGLQLPPFLTLQHVRDRIWCSRDAGLILQDPLNTGASLSLLGSPDNSLRNDARRLSCEWETFQMFFCWSLLLTVLLLLRMVCTRRSRGADC